MIARRSRQESQTREMKDLDEMNVLRCVRESTVPRDAKILDCGWAVKMKSPSEVRPRVVLKEYAVTNSMICSHQHQRA